MNVGTQLGRHRILREIGGGGLTQVFEAEDLVIGRRVALKVLAIPPGISERDKAQLVQSFQQEARAAGTLSHTNVVTLYEVGETDGTYYVATELLTGNTLRDLIRNGRPLPVDQALNILLQVARALDYAHRMGMVHRSVKPDNIMVTDDGLVKVTDFGIARAANDLLRTQKSLLTSSPAYLAPEQIRDEPVDYRTDIFAFAVTAYEVLTGRTPFEAPTPTAVMHRIVTDEPDPAPELPPRAQVALRRALSKAPGERPSSALALVEELSSAYYGTAVVSPEARLSIPREKESHSMSSSHSVAQSPRSSRYLWVIVGAIVLVAIAGVVIWRLTGQADEQFGVMIVDVGASSPAAPAVVAPNYVLNDFELSPGSWRVETAGLRLERARGGASQGAHWLKINGVDLSGGDEVAISCLPETRDWSRFGGVISLDVLVPGTAPPDLRVQVEVEDSSGGLHAMPGDGVALTPGRWSAITWQAGSVANDVAVLRVKLVCGQTPYRGYFGIDHVRAQGTSAGPAAIRYKVRVGPFTDTASMERQTARLKSLGKSPFPVREGDRRYLQVGAFTTIDSARREVDFLVAQGYRELR